MSWTCPCSIPGLMRKSVLGGDRWPQESRTLSRPSSLAWLSSGRVDGDDAGSAAVEDRRRPSAARQTAKLTILDETVGILMAALLSGAAGHEALQGGRGTGPAARAGGPLQHERPIVYHGRSRGRDATT